MRLLLDTTALLWWLAGGARLREQARAAIRSRANEVRVSSASAAANRSDLFNRLLIAQAQCEGLTIVTADRAFAAYDVPILPA